jgi:hypothetical protein
MGDLRPDLTNWFIVGKKNTPPKDKPLKKWSLKEKILNIKDLKIYLNRI